ncbi:MAG: phosphoadenylyl-sulfate reductase [Thermomicrobiales bacterium]|nr:phosphoadenylyl-sulfate reductase [Thermomicrobiales bacterium]
MAESPTLERPTALDDHEMATIAASFERRAPQDLLRWAIDCFGSRLALATSFQADGMALLDMAYRIDPGMRVLTIDSGRLRQETYDFIDQVRERYAIPIEVYSPQAADLEAFVGEHGPNPFYRSLELRVRCCEIRKVSPLTRALSGLEAWISGQRRDHLATRRSIRIVERDPLHGGIVKLNPLANWSEEQVWDYLRTHDVPHNPLYDQGFTSIGCAPCTRPTAPGDDPRAGRWWWEQHTTKECGIHCRIDWSALRA